MTARIVLLTVLVLMLSPVRAKGHCAGSDADVPPDIKAIFDKSFYNNGTWGLRVVDLNSGATLIDLRPDCDFFIGSVRKVFTVGELLNDVGPDHRYNTPVYRRGEVNHSGVLTGDLILVASGDLTMGGRTNPDGTIAVSDFDHNEADALGNAVLTKPDPLAGYKNLARQVARAGIKEIAGNVIIDDRLFQPFFFREQFNVKSIFVNDDVVDVSVKLGEVDKPALVMSRPKSEALKVENKLLTGAADTKNTFALDPELPQCIGQRGCSAKVTGQLPLNFVPPLTNQFPYVQTFRIVEPSNYARTVFIEALEDAGVKVDAPDVAQNPTQLLPQKGSYRPDTKVAELIGLPYSDDAKLILKISYNIGADTSLVLFGLTRGVDNINDALQVEKQNLKGNYGIPDTEYKFFDGSGGGDATATTRAVTKMLADLKQRDTFPVFFAALPILGVDGSLGFVTDFECDPTLAGAKGQVRAKTGTFVEGAVLKGQAFGGYITTKTGKQLAYQLVINNIPIESIPDVIRVFQDEGTISAILWRDN
jgi:D-alanyl-D-alanine carboxypeptidase